MHHCKQYILSSLIFAFCLLFVVSCTSNQIEQKTFATTETQEQELSNIIYNLYFNFTDETAVPQYTVESKVLFQLNTVSNDLAFDFKEANIRSLKVNNNTIDIPHYDGKKLIIAKKNLQKGLNTITVLFSAPSTKKAPGLKSYVDNDDKNTYFYTTQNMDLASITPYFSETPNNTTINVAVETPEKWSLVTARSLDTVSLPNNGRRLNVITQFEKQDTFHLSLAAGPSTNNKIILNKLARLWLQEYQTTATDPVKTLMNDYISYTTTDVLAPEQPIASTDTIEPTPTNTTTILAKKSFFDHLQKTAQAPCSQQTKTTLDGFIKNNPTLPDVVKINFEKTKKKFETCSTITR